MNETDWIDRVTQEEAKQLVDDAKIVYRYLKKAIPKCSYFSVIMGIRNFIKAEWNTNKEEEGPHFAEVNDKLGEIMNIMTKRW